MNIKLATAVERSGDSKLASCPIHVHECKKPCKYGHSVSATFAAQESCPKTCPFYKNGCYAELGNMRFVTGRLNNGAMAMHADSLAIAQAEAEAIDGLSGKNPLRLHVVGDCSTNESAVIVSDAAGRYHLKHDQPVWTYTHAWRSVDRASWADVSVLASCESDNDVIQATERGYAVAIVREHDNLPKTVGGLRTIKCPQQTGDKLDCFSCGLCMKGSKLQGKAAIVFDPHGVSVKKIKLALEAACDGE